MRAEDPEVAIRRGEALDVHLLLRAARQVEELAERDVLVRGVAAVIGFGQPLQPRRLVAGEEEAIAHARDRGQVLCDGIAEAAERPPLGEAELDLADRDRERSEFGHAGHPATPGWFDGERRRGATPAPWPEPVGWMMGCDAGHATRDRGASPKCAASVPSAATRMPCATGPCTGRPAQPQRRSRRPAPASRRARAIAAPRGESREPTSTSRRSAADHNLSPARAGRIRSVGRPGR
jgi:hypothetical protein